MKREGGTAVGHHAAAGGSHHRCIGAGLAASGSRRVACTVRATRGQWPRLVAGAAWHAGRSPLLPAPSGGRSAPTRSSGRCMTDASVTRTTKGRVLLDGPGEGQWRRRLLQPARGASWRLPLGASRQHRR